MPRKPSRIFEDGGNTAKVEARYGTGQDAQLLFAECPFCGVKNSDDKPGTYYSHDEQTTCDHFIEVSGGCGAYMMVFKRTKGEL